MNGTFEFFKIAWQDDGDYVNYSFIFSHARYGIIPAKTIIVEQRTNSSFFGLVKETESMTTVYENPVSLADVKMVINFIFSLHHQMMTPLKIVCPVEA
jgi:hypothetical protein